MAQFAGRPIGWLQVPAATTSWPLYRGFVCFEQRLAVEVDGGQHLDARISDASRTEWLESEGFQVLRFWNDDVLLRNSLVLEEILRALTNNRSS